MVWVVSVLWGLFDFYEMSQGVPRRGLERIFGRTGLYFEVYLNYLVYLPSEGSLTLIFLSCT